MIKEDSLRDQLTRRNLYDILVNWNWRIMLETTYKPCIAHIVLQDSTISCSGNCKSCIEHLMNEVVPKQY